MFTYARFHLGERAAKRKPVLSRRSLARMRTAEADAELGQKMGLGWSLDKIGSIPIVEHGGE